MLWKIQWFTKLSDKFCDEISDKFSESSILVMQKFSTYNVSSTYNVAITCNITNTYNVASIYNVASTYNHTSYLSFFWHQHHFQLKNLTPKTRKSREKIILQQNSVNRNTTEFDGDGGGRVVVVVVECDGGGVVVVVVVPPPPLYHHQSGDGK